MWAAPLGPAAHVFKHTEPAKCRRPSLSPAPSTVSIVSSGQTSSVAESSSAAVTSSPLTDQDDLDEPDNCSLLSDSSNNNQLVMASPSPSRLISHLSTLDSHYLQYHMEMGSKLLANLETDENPLRSLLVPRALSSPLLMNALCAVSAAHFSNRSFNSGSAEREGTNYYIDTMRGLRTTLTKSHKGSFPDDGILAVALLCKYEIVRGSVKQWAVHLDALQTLITSRGGLAQLNEETAEFVRGLYGLSPLHICRRIKANKNTYYSFIYAINVATITTQRVSKPSILGFDNVSTRKLDIYIGYTEEIIKTCSRISDLPQSSSDPLALALEVNAMYVRITRYRPVNRTRGNLSNHYCSDTVLRTWASTKTTYIIPKGMSEASLSRLRIVADCFRDAAYIYLHSTLERMSTTPAPPPASAPPSSSPLPSPSSASTSPNPAWSNLISFPKQLAIGNLVDRVRAQPIDNNCEFSALTFPLFIAGCETTVPDDRELILQTLTALEVSFGIGNVKRAKELLGILWSGDGDEGGRKHWVDVLEGLGWDLILA